jgi:hypothetical protein
MMLANALTLVCQQAPPPSAPTNANGVLTASYAAQTAALTGTVNWTPASAGANLKLNLDSVTLSGSDVLTYVDSSGNSRTVTWPVGHRPTYSATGGPNSIPCLNLLAANFCEGTFPANCFDALTAGAHIWVIAKVTDETAANGGLWTLSGDAQASWYPYTNRCIYDGAGSSARKGPSASMAGALENWHILEIIVGANYELKINGVSKIAPAANTVAWAAAPTLGTSTAAAFGGSLAGMWMFGDSTERASMAAWLTALTGIAIA